MNEEAQRLLEGELLPRERIVWSAAPDPSRTFTGADAFLVPFSLFWSGFIVFWIVSAWSQAGPGFALFGLPFVAIGFYLVVGRFFYKRRKASRTLYALTDRRVIELRGGSRQSIRAEFLDRVPSVNHHIRADGSGTVRFGSWSLMASIYGNTALDFFAGFHGDPGLAFYDIPDARRLVEHVHAQRSGGDASTAATPGGTSTATSARSSPGSCGPQTTRQPQNRESPGRAGLT